MRAAHVKRCGGPRQAADQGERVAPGKTLIRLRELLKATFHRTHPGKEALRYRVRAAREFLTKIGVIA